MLHNCYKLKTSLLGVDGGFTQQNQAQNHPYLTTFRVRRE